MYDCDWDPNTVISYEATSPTIVKKFKLESYENRPHYEKFSITDRFLKEEYAKVEIMERFKPNNPYDAHTHTLWLSEWSIKKLNITSTEKITWDYYPDTSKEKKQNQVLDTKRITVLKDISNMHNSLLADRQAAAVDSTQIRNYYKKVDGVRKYQCLICGKVFSQLWILRNHQLQHTGQRPYVCPEESCKASFSDRSNMRAHQRAKGHHEWKYKCQRCQKPFSQQRFLMTHKTQACNKFYIQRQFSKKLNN